LIAVLLGAEGVLGCGSFDCILGNSSTDSMGIIDGYIATACVVLVIVGLFRRTLFLCPLFVVVIIQVFQLLLAHHSVF
jgi:hypothetical protein